MLILAPKTSAHSIVTVSFTGVAILVLVATTWRLWSRGERILALFMFLVATAFYGKWLLLSPEHVPRQMSPNQFDRLPQDRHAALVATNAFTVGMLTGGLVGRRKARADKPPMPPRALRSHHSWSRKLSALVCVLVGIRTLLATIGGVGVRGDAAQGSPILGIASLVVEVGSYAVLGILAGVAGARPIVVAPAALLAGVGVALGARSSAVLVVLVLVIGLAYSPAPDREFKPSILKTSLIGASVLLVLAVALEVRPTASTEREGIVGAAEFTVARVGGFEYLSAVAAHRTGRSPDPALVTSANFNQYLVQDVYGFPSGTQTGVSGTAIGWALSFGGLAATAVTGAALAASLRVAERLISFLRSRTRKQAYAAIGFGASVALAATNLLLEGTSYAAFRIALIGTGSSLAATFLMRSQGLDAQRTNPERGGF